MMLEDGKRLEEAMEDPTRLTALLEVSLAGANKIIALCSSLTPKVDAIASLAKENLPERMRADLCADDAVALQKDPYHLCVALGRPPSSHKRVDVLRAADELARARGLTPDDARRAGVYMEHAIHTLSW